MAPRETSAGLSVPSSQLAGNDATKRIANPMGSSSVVRFLGQARYRRSRRLGLLLLIVALGMAVRVASLAWGQGYRYAYITSEVEAYQCALGYMAGEERAQYLGQPNFNYGKVPGPLWAIFWAASLRFGGTPYSVMWAMLLVNVAVIPLVYVLAQKLLGPAYSLWAALFYATSPWAVDFSMGCLNFSPMAFLGAVLFLALWDVVQRPGSAHIFWVCVALAMMPQFHMMGVFLVPASLLIITSSPVPVSKRWLVAGIGIAAALYVPYVRGETAHHWSNTRHILGSETNYTAGVLKTLTLPITVLSNTISSWTGVQVSDYLSFGNAVFGSFYVVALFNATSLILAAVYLGYFLRELFQSIRGHGYSLRALFRAAPAMSFIGTLLLVPIFLFIVTGHNFSSRYLFVQFPILMLLPALCVVDKFLRSPRRRLLMSTVAITIAFDVVVTLQFFHYVGNQIEHGDYFIASFRKLQQVYDVLQADAGYDVRISVDADEHGKSVGIKPRLGGNLISMYVRVREDNAHRGRQPTIEKTYQIRSTASPVAPHERVVFAANGIKLVALSSAAHEHAPQPTAMEP